VAPASRYSLALLLAFLVFFAGLGLVWGPGLYGFTLFMLIPMALGGLGAWLFRPATRWRAAGVGALSAGTCAASLLVWCCRWARWEAFSPTLLSMTDSPHAGQPC
jgi:hypothetical protein